MTHMTHFPIEVPPTLQPLVKRMRHGASCVMLGKHFKNRARGQIAFIFEGSRTTGPQVQLCLSIDRHKSKMKD
jgi:hypothetical protein